MFLPVVFTSFLQSYIFWGKYSCTCILKSELVALKIQNILIYVKLRFRHMSKNWHNDIEIITQSKYYLEVNKKVCTKDEVLLKEIYMCSMKTVSLTVYKLWPMWKVLLSESISKVKNICILWKEWLQEVHMYIKCYIAIYLLWGQ